MDAMLCTGRQVYSLAPHIAKSYISTFKLAWVEGSLMFCGHACARCPMRYPWVYFNHKNFTQIQQNSNMETTINHDLIEDLNSISSGWRPYSSHFPTMDNHPVHYPAPARPLSCLSKSSISTLTLFLRSSAWSPRRSKTTSRFGIIYGLSPRGGIFSNMTSLSSLVNNRNIRVELEISTQNNTVIKRVHHPWKRRLTLIKWNFIMWAAFTTSLLEFSKRSTQKDSHD